MGMITRRNLIRTGVSGLVLATFDGTSAAVPDADAELAKRLDIDAQALLRRSPEAASELGQDVGALADLRRRLDDRSSAGRAAWRGEAQAALGALSAIDARHLSSKGRLDLATARFVQETLAEGLAKPGMIDLNLRPSPYVVSQMGGAYYWLPDLFGSAAPLKTAQDREDWLLRLGALATALDQETDRIGSDAARGYCPPGFVIDRTLAQMAALRDAAPERSALIAPAAERAVKSGLADLTSDAEAVFRSRVAPALDRQKAALEALRANAGAEGGVWRHPDGEAWYRYALAANTTVDTDPATLHAEGQDQVAGLVAELDRALAAQGMTRGSVGERIKALNHDPRSLVSNDDTGRARLLAAAQERLDKVMPRLPTMFLDPVVDPVGIKRMAPGVEAGSPGAFYNDGAAGESAALMLNLARPEDQALWRLPTLIHHELVPGHHFQYSAVRHAAGLPLFRRMILFSAYTEGWALYAEQVADEMGVDPLGRIGYLQSQLFRAGRIVVDTGLHAKRWSREAAVSWMVDTIGEPLADSRREIDRYCVYPGQACSFKVGANAIVAAREAARRRLGARFDIRRFHAVILNAGPVPMGVLTAALADWDGA
jgi:uncharacterized protein (DUF885 family)